MHLQLGEHKFTVHTRLLDSWKKFYIRCVLPEDQSFDIENWLKPKTFHEMSCLENIFPFIIRLVRSSNMLKSFLISCSLI